MEQVAFLFSNAFHIYIVFRFANRIFLTYTSSKKSLFAAICYYILNSLCSLYLGIPILNLLSSIIGLCFLVIPCSDRWIKRIFFVMLITSIGYVCDVLFYTLFNNPGYLLTIGIITNFILFIVELGIETFFYGKFKSNFEKKEWGALFCIPIGSMLMLFILDMTYGIPQSLRLLCAIVCFLINIIIFHFYDTLSSYYDQLLIAHQNEHHIELYKNKIVTVETTEKQMNSFRHDLNNHISIIKEMAKQENNSNIIMYLDNMLNSTFVENNRVFTRHKDFNLLVNYLYDKAVASAIEPIIEINIPNTLQCNIYDINIILSNLFDNALEACTLTSEKVLKLSIKYSKGIFQIAMKNSHCNSFKMIKNTYVSTKPNSELHGYGLKNIEWIVKKYHGNVEYEHNDHMFFAKVIMYI